MTDADKRILSKKIQLLSKRSKDDVEEISQAYVIQMLFDFLEDKETSIPLIGSFRFTYDGDKIENGERKALFVTEFNIDPFLQKVLGQATDGEETDIEKIFKQKLKSQLEKYVG